MEGGEGDDSFYGVDGGDEPLEGERRGLVVEGEGMARETKQRV